jgi:hypothetical protein
LTSFSQGRETEAEELGKKNPGIILGRLEFGIEVGKHPKASMLFYPLIISPFNSKMLWLGFPVMGYISQNDSVSKGCAILLHLQVILPSFSLPGIGKIEQK